jgi:hypothetical protein
MKLDSILGLMVAFGGLPGSKCVKVFRMWCGIFLSKFLSNDSILITFPDKTSVRTNFPQKPPTKPNKKLLPIFDK